MAAVQPFLQRHPLTLLSVVPPILVYLGAYFPCLIDNTIGQIVFVISIIANAYSLHQLAWMISGPYLYTQLFRGLGSRGKAFGSAVFQYIIPTCLFAAILKRDSTPLEYDLKTAMHLVYYFVISFAASFQTLYVYRILKAKWRFERGQDLQHFTRDIWIIYSGEESSLTHKTAIELADDPAFEGFYVSVMSLDEARGEDMVDGGALLLLFVLNPNECKPDLSNAFSGWLREEADLRISESRTVGALKNIAYTPEGTRRTSFLRLKFAVFSLNPTKDSMPSADIPLYVDQYMGQFGALRLLDLTVGTSDTFGAWISSLTKEIGKRVVNPIATHPVMTRKTSPDPYLSWFEFVRWLDSCPDCSSYHQYEVEKLRERTSIWRPSNFDWFCWWLTKTGRYEYNRGYEPFGKWDDRLRLTIQTSLLLGYFVATYYLPEFDRVTLFFNVMAVYFLISIAPLTYWLTPVTDKFKSQALLPPKYHFHQNASHYEEEVRAKKGLAPASPEKDGDGKPKSADRSGSYCPLESQEELVKVAFSNPLFNPESEEKEQQEEKEGGGDDDGDDEGLVVNPGFRFDPSATIHFYDVWVREFVMKDLGCQPLCWVKHPVTELDFPIQVAPGRVNIPQYNVPNPVNEQDKVLIDYFAAFKPGMPPPSMDDMHIDKSLQNQLRRAMKRHLILVSPNYWANEKAHWAKELERIRKEMRATGMSAFKNLLQKPQMEAYRNYSRRLWETLGGWKINEEMKMQKCQWNDEPFGRYLNHALTNFAVLIAEEPLMHPGLVLPIFIMKGLGFPLHMDSVPPFDLTLDMVVDHLGPSDRPVTFLHHDAKKGFGMTETKAALHPGESVIFRGSELPHFGWDLPAKCYHNVVLFTWSLARD